jgi:hypothetical protein
MYLKKSNKKTAAFTASGLETLRQVFPGSQSLNLLVIRTRSKSRQPFTGGHSLPTDAVILQNYRPLVKAFSIFLYRRATYLFTPPIPRCSFRSPSRQDFLPPPGSRLESAETQSVSATCGTGPKRLRSAHKPRARDIEEIP